MGYKIDITGNYVFEKENENIFEKIEPLPSLEPSIEQRVEALEGAMLESIMGNQK